MQATRILGLDPGLRRTGWGIIEVEGPRLRHVAHGVIEPDEKAEFSARLLVIYRDVTKLVVQYKPHESAIEETFLNTNASSTLKLGHARGAAIVPPAEAGLKVAEYAAKVVKKAVVGTGAATKEQVLFMIRRLLPTANLTSTDAADALAVAITHAHARSTKVF